jgi:hypothetical protein
MGATLFWRAGAAWQAAPRPPPDTEEDPVPPTDRGLLARLDALVELAADRHGLALLPDGRLAAAEARVAVRATGLTLPGGLGSAHPR